MFYWTCYVVWQWIFKREQVSETDLVSPWVLLQELDEISGNNRSNGTMSVVSLQSIDKPKWNLNFRCHLTSMCEQTSHLLGHEVDSNHVCCPKWLFKYTGGMPIPKLLIGQAKRCRTTERSTSLEFSGRKTVGWALMWLSTVCIMPFDPMYTHTGS